MKAKGKLKKERRTARREELLRRLDETLTPLPDGAAEHLKSIAQEHVASEDCWCGPEVEYMDPETGAAVYVHKRPQ